MARNVDPPQADPTDKRQAQTATGDGPGAKARADETGAEGTVETVAARTEGGADARKEAGRVPAQNASGSPPAPPSTPAFHKRLGPVDFTRTLHDMKKRLRVNMAFVVLMTCATNILILAVPIYLFQISDRVFTSRSTDTLVMLTIVIAGAIVVQTLLDAVRRLVLMRSAVDVAARLGAPVLSAAAQASLHSNGREYQVLGDLNALRSFLVSGTLLSFLDVPFAPIFVLAVFLIHPHLGTIVVVTALILMLFAWINQKITSDGFSRANIAQTRANLHLESMSRNSQIINAMAMIPEAVSIWGRDTAASLRAQTEAQDRNVFTASASRMFRLFTQIGMLGWGAYLALDGQITGGMVIAASIVAGRALAPIEGAIEGWNSFLLARGAYDRVGQLLASAKTRNDKLRLPKVEGRLDIERLLYVPQGTKHVVLNALTFSLAPGDQLAIIGNSGAGKTTLGKMLVGSVLPTSGAVRLDLMDIRNWDPRQFGESIGYLPQDVQLFPGTIKQNIARMREDASDAAIHRAAALADVHEMIASLPQGYETVVSSDGSPLSGGQKQRIGLARAFFGDPKFVVLDEPNSNLDTQGDAALVRALGHAKANGITVVVVTQKPSLLSAVDKIMLLNDGNIAMFGWRDQMLAELERRKQAKAQQVQQQRAAAQNVAATAPMQGAPA
ncbi:type I secretion system permease/ATPase [Thioclava sp. JM3]|nr:type I secretion system permease/ATPase [Thioclava sp. IC9]OWY01329.1 type I secretion system permease/ATPase [Thioclava sp. F1Mire-8]OWY08803.1 type I secretion system permease/ATPase [Thioclava sp. F42-5]OWY11928.1 type I secretion system permease/ATPase [Thioclava sp. F34-6]OWY15876.1 type I secretion system permease/ATPase [Thioclava sp. JM3]